MLHINFEYIKLHNFGSYKNAEFNLKNKGFCLVSGQNNYIKDNAASNGSGKSLLWNAICYALSGETINGLTKGLHNINADEPEMFVELAFFVNSDHYLLKRGELPAKYLKITKNDLDLSGKTYTESLAKLSDLLPDLTRDLITSVIILGQAMPNKFSSLSAVDKKQRLEQLFKADFMIEDIKNRVAARQAELTTQLRTYEDSLLVLTTQLTAANTSLTQIKDQITNFKFPDYNTEILQVNTQILASQKLVQETEHTISTSETYLEALNSKLLKISAEKTDVAAAEFEAYNKKYLDLTNQSATLNAQINAQQSEITRLKNIKDICPTCGQKIPGIQKPDTSKQEAILATLQIKIDELKAQLDDCNAKHEDYLQSISSQFDVELANLTTQVTNQKAVISAAKSKYAAINAEIASQQSQLIKLQYEKENLSNTYTSLIKKAADLELEIKTLTDQQLISNDGKEDINKHLGVLKKMESLIKRDFRGYLLTNIISFINKKAKDFSEIVFKTRDLDLALNGTSLDITYCGKLVDNLSGGEKTRVDLIMQLAIRATLMTYLGFNSNILVLDEITDFLDSKSCRATMELLAKEVNTVESVFIVSHRAQELALPIDTEVKIIKNKLGESSIC